MTVRSPKNLILTMIPLTDLQPAFRAGSSCAQLALPALPGSRSAQDSQFKCWPMTTTIATTAMTTVMEMLMTKPLRCLFPGARSCLSAPRHTTSSLHQPPVTQAEPSRLQSPIFEVSLVSQSLKAPGQRPIRQPAQHPAYSLTQPTASGLAVPSTRATTQYITVP